ncbi:MAG TPA: glycosyltransferase family 2 protein, partial [bacterium]|nr:glycosyltransferase family 2 protein [bacterium]
MTCLSLPVTLLRMKQWAYELSVVIPVLNEEKTIETVLDRVLDLDIPLEIVVVDDGSTDATPAILEHRKSVNVMVLTHSRNRGKGAAIQTALPHLRGRYTVIQDGDLEYNPADFHRLLEVMQAENAQVVFGSRILGRQPMSYLRYWLGGRGVTLATNLLFGSRITDE